MKNQYRGTESTWPVIRKLIPEGSGTILDAGSGEHKWSKKGWTITRCDSGQEYKGGRQLDGVQIVDLNGPWPYPDNSFNGVIAADVIEHLENLWHFFREAFRVASDFVIVSTPNVEGPMSKVMFRQHGRLWGFFPQEINKSGHRTPIFRWQLGIVCLDNGWVTETVTFAHHPLQPRVARRWGLERFLGVRANKRTLIAMFVPEEA